MPTNKTHRFLRDVPWLLLGAVLLLRIGIVDAHFIPSGSMQPTLAVGDMILADKTAYGFTVPFTDKQLVGWDTPQRGDIVTFVPEHRDDLLIKRVIGLPGDVVAIHDGRLMVNGRWISHRGKDGLVYEDLGNISYRINPDLHRDFGPVRVPADHLLVLGDNRGNSADSRVWGFLPIERVRAKAVFRHFSLAWLNEPAGFSRFGDLYQAPVHSD